jgi:hypothetical protein
MLAIPATPARLARTAVLSVFFFMNNTPIWMRFYYFGLGLLPLYAILANRARVYYLSAEKATLQR